MWLCAVCLMMILVWRFYFTAQILQTKIIISIIHSNSHSPSDFLFPSLRNSRSVLHSLDKPVSYSLLLKKFKFCVKEVGLPVGLSKVGWHPLRGGGGWLMLWELGPPILLCKSACGSSQTIWLVIMQPCLQKSFAQQVILLFNLFLTFIFNFYFILKKKKRKIPKIKTLFGVHLYIYLFAFFVCIWDLINVLFYWIFFRHLCILWLANKNFRIWVILGKK